MPATTLTPAIRDEIARLGQRRHHGRHPELQERGDDRLRGAGGARRARPVLPGPQAGPRQLRRRLPDGTQRVVIETEPPDYVERILLVRPTNRLDRVTLTYPEIDGVGGKGAALRTIFEIAAALDVQALVVVDSDLRIIVPEWIELLAGPILKGGYDFVAPLYARYKYDGTITNTVTYPLTRALYGHRIRQPIGGDFGVSGDLVRHYLELDDWTDGHQQVRHRHLDDDVRAHRRVRRCQTRLGAKVHDPKDPGSDLGPMFRQVVGTILRLAADAPRRRGSAIRGSHDVPAYGFERIIDPPPLEVNSIRLLSEFHGGSLTVADTWRRTLRQGARGDGAELAAEAGKAADEGQPALGVGGEGGSRRATPTTIEMAEALRASTSPTTCGRAASTTS